MQLTLPLVITTGLLDSLNPCAISLLLLYIALLFSMHKSHKQIMVFGGFYIIAVYLTYFMIGLGLLRVFHLFSVPNLIVKIGAWLAIIFGVLNLKEYFFPDLPIHLRISLERRKKIAKLAHKATIPTAVVMGFMVGTFEFPCSGSVYLTILSLLRAQTTFAQGILYLLLYNFMFVLPLVFIYTLATNKVVVEKMINWQEQNGRKLLLILAAVMIALGATILIWFA